jgi:xanthine/CO dehydrogenase XdhC/CoxF family maturation factor
MKELQDIVAAFEKIEHCGQIAALATVTEVRGSTYRRPGARMLITQDGCRVGSISGGCLEADVVERSQQVMASGEPMLVQYDTTSPDDIIWGLGLGCNGLVRVFIERLTQQNKLHPVGFISECYRRRQIGVIATVLRAEGELLLEAGTHLMLQQDGSAIAHIKDSTLAALILDDARAALRHNQSALKQYQLPVGNVEVFIEAIQPPVPLVIFGAGDDAIPVVGFAKGLGWHVTVVDSRQSYATSTRFPAADAVIVSRPEQISDAFDGLRQRITIDPRTVAVVMTHNYLQDRELLKTLLPSCLRYLGILGPKSRTERLLQELLEQGAALTENHLSRLYAPVGIDIGADNPEEIALAIVAEIRAVLANRSGGLLRDRKGSIHNQVNGLDKNSKKCAGSRQSISV